MIDVRIENELSNSYLDYSLSVIIGRALPDIRDGLKPVQRRIIYSMYELGNTHNKPYKKSARIVGEVLGKYHPHGDSAIYEALVRMAQPFSMRYPLVDGQGNFGSIDGDSPAAMRYTEVRMSKIAEEMLKDIEKETVAFTPNFDNTLSEPVVFPTAIPQLLLNGSSGIAVGMATNIPPHNMNEIGEALIAVLEGKKEEVMNIVKGPDFPTGGVIVGQAGIRSAYSTGRGIIKLRGKIEYNQKEHSLHIREVPYQANKATIVEEIVQASNEGLIEGVSKVEDRSDKEGIDVAIMLKKGASPEVVEKQIYKNTGMQSSFGIIFLAVDGKTPKIYTLLEILEEFLKFREEIIRKRSMFELKKADERKHILDGLLKAIAKIDSVVDRVKKAESTEAAVGALIKLLGIDEIQAKAILEMKLSRIIKMEREEIEAEVAELKKKIDYLKGILEHRERLLEVVKAEIKEEMAKFGDERRTQLAPADEEEEEIILENKEEFIIRTSKGYMKRVPAELYKEQKRGGKGVISARVGEDESIVEVLACKTKDTVLLFGKQGRVYAIPAYKIAREDRYGKGVHTSSLLTEEGVEVIKMLSIDEDADYSGKSFFFVTKKGVVKRTPVDAFKRLGRVGVRAIVLKEGDVLVDVKIVSEDDEIILLSSKGMSIRFDANDVRNMGRVSAGVRGMRLKEDDYVVSASYGRDAIFIVTERGYGKRVESDRFRKQHRGGKGIRAIKLVEKTGNIAGAKAISDDSAVIILTEKGKSIMFEASDVRVMGRQARGVRVMRVEEGDRVSSLAVL
ncbi:MAG: DNA gyrase subunit A [Candidatus Anstonellales archaeon]